MQTDSSAGSMQPQQRPAPGGAALHPPLALDVLRHIVAHVKDGATRRALRASSSGLRRLVNASAAELAFPEGREGADAMRHVAARCEQWRGVRVLRVRGAGAESVRALLDLLDAAARCAGQFGGRALGGRLSCDPRSSSRSRGVRTHDDLPSQSTALIVLLAGTAPNLMLCRPGTSDATLPPR
jgi:hypothetical protein